MIKTHKICGTDEAPFVAICESFNGNMLILAVTEHDRGKAYLEGKIIQGFGKRGDLRTGLVRAFHPYGEWTVIESDKTPRARQAKAARKAERLAKKSPR